MDNADDGNAEDEDAMVDDGMDTVFDGIDDGFDDDIVVVVANDGADDLNNFVNNLET